MDAFSCAEEFVAMHKKIRGTMPDAGDVSIAINKEADEVKNGLYRVGKSKSEAEYNLEVQKLLEALCDLSHACMVATKCFRGDDWKDMYLFNHEAIVKKIKAEEGKTGLAPADGKGKLVKYFDNASTAKFVANSLFKRM